MFFLVNDNVPYVIITTSIQNPYYYYNIDISLEQMNIPADKASTEFFVYQITQNVFNG